MQARASRVRFVCLLFVLCYAAAGCGLGYPYYTLEGSPESRVVVIHLKDGKTEKIPAGTGMGGGLTAEQKAVLMTGEDVIIEKGAARVTMTAKGPLVLVKTVEYDGQEVQFHEPVL